jgi:N-acylneuraminate cytidylyltransferase
MLAIRSQDLTPAYFDTGSFYAYPTGTVTKSEGAGDYSAYVGHPLPRHKAIDIDSEDDLSFAELLFIANMRGKAQ